MATETQTLRRSSFLVPLFALPILLLTAMASAQPKVHPVMSAFEPTGEYRLMIDGVQAEAEVYLSKRAAAVLLVSSTLEQPLLVWARSARVDSIAPESILRSGNRVDLADTVERKYLGDYRPEEAALVLPIEGRDVRLAPKAALVGDHTLAELFEHSPEYRATAAAYTPDAAALDTLRAADGTITVQVFFGSWCSVCKKFMPNLLRVVQELDGAGLRFEYYGVDYPPGGWQDSLLKQHQITGLPTALVTRGDRELGRLVGAEGFAHPETELVEMLGKR